LPDQQIRLPAPLDPDGNGNSQTSAGLGSRHQQTSNDDGEHELEQPKADAGCR
jgi:hypothetical protein